MLKLCGKCNSVLGCRGGYETLLCIECEGCKYQHAAEFELFVDKVPRSRLGGICWKCLEELYRDFI